MKLPNPQTRKDYPKQKEAKQGFNFRKLKSTIKRYAAILLLAAGSIRTVINESDNKVIVIAAGVILIVLLVEIAVSKVGIDE